MDSLTATDLRTVGEFRLLARLGSGGMGQVFLASSLAGRIVAVKVIHRELCQDTEFVRRFRNEVEAAQKVSGWYTAPVVAAGVDDNPPWLATAFVPGPSLDDIVTRYGPLPLPAVWRLAAGLAEALRAIHAAGLIHRDLKPANVLLAPDGPRVIDFGISRTVTDTRLTATGAIIGTLSYMSPEQVQGLETGPVSDTFSLGSVLAYAASGAAPFSGGPGAPSASVMYRIVYAEPDLGAVPADIRGLVEACLAKDPAQRPDLGRVAAHSTATAERLGLSPAAFWPQEVARVISAQQAALTAQIEALQVAPGTQVERPWGGSGGGTGGATRGGGGMAAAPSRPSASAPTWPSAAGGRDAAHSPATDPARAPGFGAVAGGGLSGGGTSGGLSSPGGVGPGGQYGPGGVSGPAGLSGPGGLYGPGGAGGPGAGIGGDGLDVLGQVGTRGTSRRGLLIGAGVGSIAVIGGAVGWALSSRTPGGGTPAAESGNITAPTGQGLPTGQPLQQYYGAGTRRTAAWKVATGNTIEANPGAGGGLVYVASTDNNIYAVNIAAKRQVWTFEAGSVTAAPEVIGDVVCLSTIQGHFYALHVADGKLAWDLDTSLAASYKRTWAVNGGNVILGTDLTSPQAYDAVTGTKGVRYSTQEPYVMALSAAGGVLYAVDASGVFYAFHAATGTEIWHQQLLSSDDLPETGLTIDSGGLYVGTISGALYKVDATTGKVLWTYHPGSGMESNVIVADGVVYLRDNNGTLHAISAANKKQLWVKSGGGSGIFGPAVAGGRVYYTTSLALQALDAKSGDPVWAFTAPNNAGLFASPVVANGLVFIGSSDDGLYAVQA
jgi:outer membrane protein assembly factor BamB